MSPSNPRSASLLAAVGCWWALAAGPATAQENSTAPPGLHKVTTELTPGQAALGGIWYNPYGAHRLVDPKDPRLVRPKTAPPMLTPEYAARTKVAEQSFMQSRASGVGGLKPTDFVVRRQLLCLPYGLPSMMSANMSFDIHVAKDRVAIIGETDREVRRIWLDRDQKPLDDVDLGYWGRSVGHWEGDTLVVSTIGLKDEIYGEDFMTHSDKAVMAERISSPEPDILRDEVTITDPLALREPYKFVAIYKRASPNYEPIEFVCDELPVTKVDAKGNLTLDTSKVK